MDVRDIDPATATREQIRAYVKANSTELAAFAASGGNSYQKSLDQKDQLDSRLIDMSDEQKQRFLSIYAEELDANNRFMEQDALNKSKLPNETTDSSGLMVAVILMVVIAGAAAFYYS